MNTKHKLGTFFKFGSRKDEGLCMIESVYCPHTAGDGDKQHLYKVLQIFRSKLLVHYPSDYDLEELYFPYTPTDQEKAFFLLKLENYDYGG